MTKTTQKDSEPILVLARTAEWLEVTPALIAKARQNSQGRLTTMSSANVIPCSNKGCEVFKNVGERILVIHFNGEPTATGRGQKRDRYFCDVPCQRQNYHDEPERFMRRRAKA